MNGAPRFVFTLSATHAAIGSFCATCRRPFVARDRCWLASHGRLVHGACGEPEAIVVIDVADPDEAAWALEAADTQQISAGVEERRRKGEG